MRWRQVLGVALVSAGAVVAADLLMHSTLLRALRPQIVSPADGAIINGPVTVRWEGPQPMEATLTGNGQRIALGTRESPFEIDPTRFPRPGQYGIELSAPRLGSLIRADRRFMVRRAPLRGAAAVVDSPETPPLDRAGVPAAEHAALGEERDQLRVELAAMQSELVATQRDRDQRDAALDALQMEGDARLAATEARRDELAREYLLALQEVQALRSRLASIPACTVWGYLATARVPGGPPTRTVTVSDRAGNVFRNEPHCAAMRRTDPAGLSGCVCVGAIE